MSEFAKIGEYATPMQACESVGVRYREAKRDGFNYLDLETSHGGKGDGRLIYFPNGRGGAVFNQRTKEYALWFDGRKNRQGLTEFERREIENVTRNFKAQEHAKHLAAAHCARRLYQASVPIPKYSHPYLRFKHVVPVDTLRVIAGSKALGIYRDYCRKVRGFTPVGFQTRGGGFLNLERPLIVVPMRGELAPVQAVQLIDNNGHKSFLSGCKKSGAYWQSERLPEYDPETTMTFGVGEGVATVLSVRQVKGFPVVAAMDCGNLKPVALNIRARFPRAKIIILSDVGNGEKEALIAAQAVDGWRALPEFTDTLIAKFKAIRGNQEPTDFNDYYLARGDI